MGRVLPDAKVRTFREKGYVTVPRFFTAEQIQAVDDYLVRNADVKWTDKNDDPLREAHYLHRPIYDICTLPKLLDAVEQLIGPDLVLLYSHIINKKPGGGLGVRWHQDGPYWPRIEPKIAVSAWIALDDADVENGCMQVIPGSHAGHVDLGQSETADRDLIQDHAIALPDGVVDDSKAENVILRRGDVSFHDSYIVHGSQPNRSTRRRAALVVRFVPSATRIQPRPDRKQYLVRGRPVENGNVYMRFGE
ncbi:MAG: phytanoyl-CoA dioxygenase family protein [Planctomycetes bacterium]|nr:phytanoyl-CoA dioxygenase family protein [Planctomycetota bacterium]